MKENYTYPVILDYNDEGAINLLFPTFEYGMTCVERGEDPIKAAQEWLVLEIVDREGSGCGLPDENGDEGLEITEGQKLIYVNVWMPYHRSTVKEEYVKKTLTIPAWLDILAKQNNINFSATLVKGIKEELGIS